MEYNHNYDYDPWNKMNPCPTHAKLFLSKRKTFHMINFRKCSYPLSNVNLSGKDFRDSTFDELNLENSNLTKAHFVFATFRKANLKGTNSTQAKFMHSNFKGATASDAVFIKADFSQSELDLADFTDSDFSGANFSNAKIGYTKFTRANMQKVNFKEAIMTSVNFSGANLSLANLTNADVEFAYFTGCDLRKANFSGANLVGANFTGADLTKADFTGANVSDAIFTGAKGYKPPDEQFTLNREQKTILLLNQFPQIKPLQLQVEDIKTVQNKFSDSVFDISLGEEVPITEIDDDEDNVILYIDKQTTGILYPRDELKKAYTDRTAVFVGCQKSSLSAVPISIVNTDSVYIKLNITIAMFIKLQHMVQLLSSKHREWFLQKTDKNEEFTANVHHVYDNYNSHNNVFNRPLNIVSGVHCQPGSNQPVYNLTPIKFTSTPARNSPARNLSPVIPSPLKNKQKRCPKGTQKNKRTGNCEKKGSASPNVIAINDSPDVQILPNVVAVQPKDKRCPKGTRKNKATGNCEPK